MNESHRKRGPLQFSLRSLLMLTLLVAAFFAGWAANEWRHRREVDAMQIETVNDVMILRGSRTSVEVVTELIQDSGVRTTPATP